MQTIKTLFSNWRSFSAKSKISNNGTEYLQLSEPGTVFAHKGKETIPIAYGTRFTLTTDADTYSCSTVCIVKRRRGEPLLPNGVRYTNDDRRPHMSPAEQAVTLALRKLNRKQRQLDEQREALLDATSDPAPEPAPEPTPEPTPQPNDDTPAGE